MADEKQVQETTVTEPAPEGDKPEPPQTVPYNRFAEVIAKGKSETERADVAEKKLAAQDADKKRVRDAKLLEDGEFKTAIAERDAEIETIKSERDTAVTKWNDHEALRREALNQTEGLTDDDKAMAERMGIGDAELFVTRISNIKDSPGTDTRKAARVGVTLKPMSEMTAQEIRDTHDARKAQYQN